MPPRPQRDYWDANVFLCLFQKGDDPKRLEQRENSIRLLEDIRQGKGVIITSALTIVEARRGEGVPPLPGEEHATLRAFFKHTYIEVVPVDRGIAELAAEYGERFRLKNFDAVQLATAVRSKASRLLAWDGDFHRKVAMQNPPLPIEYPWRPPDPQPPMLEAIEAAEAAEAAAKVADDDSDDLDDDATEALAEDADELADDVLDEDGDTDAEEAETTSEGTSTAGQAPQVGPAVRGSGQTPAEHAPAQQGPAPSTS